MSETSDAASPKKILIVRLGAMGDVIHAMPAVAGLRIMFPNAHIGWIIEERWSDLLRLSPIVDSVHTVDTRRWRKHLLKSEAVREAVASLRDIRAQHYDVTIDFQGAIKSALLAVLSGTPERYGFANPWEKPAGLFYTHTVRPQKKHVIQQNLELVMSFAEKEHAIQQGGLARFISADARLHDWANKRTMQLGLTGRFVMLNPGAGWGAKQWPIERYTEVARALGSSGIRSLINFGPGEEALARHVEQCSDGHAVAASFAISELVAITSNATLFIGGDTGPLHLAAMLQIPVVAIFGPTDPARTGPYGTRSIVLRDPSSITSHKRHRDTEAGLKNISTEEVLNAAFELLRVNREGVRA